MIPRRSSGESCSGFGSDARRSSMTWSMCSWIGVVGDRLGIISREISAAMTRSLAGVASRQSSYRQNQSGGAEAHPVPICETLEGSQPSRHPVGSDLEEYEKPIRVL